MAERGALALYRRIAAAQIDLVTETGLGARRLGSLRAPPAGWAAHSPAGAPTGSGRERGKPPAAAC
jgi:hypothetical protein